MVRPEMARTSIKVAKRSAAWSSSLMFQSKGRRITLNECTDDNTNNMIMYVHGVFDIVAPSKLDAVLGQHCWNDSRDVRMRAHIFVHISSRAGHCREPPNTAKQAKWVNVVTVWRVLVARF